MSMPPEPLMFLSIIAVVDFFIALYVLGRNPQSSVNRAFFIFVFGISAWILGIVLLFSTKIFIFDRMVFLGGTLTFFGLLIFAKVFPRGEPPERSFWFHALPFLVSILAVPFNVFVRGMIIHEDGSIQPINGPLLPLYLLAMGGYVMFSLWLLGRNYARSLGLARLQMQYLFVGISLFIISAIVFDGFLPSLGIFQFNLLGPASSIIFIGLTAYAIVRYQLMDIRVVIQRGVIYSVFATIVFFVYLMVALVLGEFLKLYAGFIPALSAALAAIIVVLGYPKLEEFLRAVTDQIFFKNHYSTPRILRRSSEILNATLDFEKAYGRIADLLKDTLKISALHFFVYEEKQLRLFPEKRNAMWEKGVALARELQIYFPGVLSNIRGGITQEQIKERIAMRRKRGGVSRPDEAWERLLGTARAFNVALLLLVFAKEKFSGLLALEAKRSGERFFPQDREFLDALVHQIGLALENFRFYEAQKRHAESLESEVRERTYELSRLHETQIRLIQDLSHGIQTPLAVMKSMIDAELKTHGHKPEHKNLHALEGMCANISTITQRILLLASSDRGLEPKRRAMISLHELLHDLGEQISILAEDKEIVFRMELDGEVTVLGDRERLVELFTELLSNALKFTPSGGSIRLTLAKSGNVAFVSVADTGRGISQEDLPHAFERFFRVQSGEEGHSGNGLGLAIADSITKAHGGSIKVESVLGRGSTFTVQLPLAAAS